MRARILPLAVVISAGVFGVQPILGAGWYDVTWPYRKSITIHAAQVAGNLAGFPVLIELENDIDLISNAQANGLDILFTAADGTTKLDHEIEQFTHGADTLTAWVKVPNLSSTTDTVLYIYYGNASAADQQNVSGVWNSGFGGVWHLDEAGAPYTDVSGHANNSTSGTYPVQESGVVNNAQRFNGTSQRFLVPASPSIELTNNGTVSAWFQFNQLKQSDLLEKGGANGYTLWQDSGVIWWGLQNSGNWVTSIATFSVGQWYKIDGVINNGILSLYVNGALDVSGGSATAFANTGALQFGNGVDGWYGGILDEVRITNVLRTAQWLQTEFNNQNSPDTFYAVAAQVQVPSVTFTAASQSALESAGTMTVTAQLSAAMPYDVSVPFTVGGTAGNPSDYTITASPLTIAAGTTTASATINIVDDKIDEPNETVILTMGTPTGAVAGTTTIHTATIMDDDVAGVTIAQSGGSTAVTEGGATDTYTVVLNSQPTANVTIAISTDGKTTVSPISLTFTAADWNVPQMVTVTAVDDAVAEGLHASTITHAATSGDINYSGIVIAGVTVSITDNDSAGVTVTESSGSTRVTEGGATDTYTVVLNSQPTANVTIAIGTDGKTTVNPASLTFTAADWNMPQTVTVTAVDDLIAEGPHSSVISHTVTSADAVYNGLSVNNVTVTITDNDSAGVTVTEPGGSTHVVEGGATDTYTLALQSQPLADVTVAVSTDGKTTVNPVSLTFTAANWNVPQTVMVAAVDDLIAEGPHSSIIRHTVTSADAMYNGLTVSSVTVAITDNDSAGVTITESGGSTHVTEGGATDTYTVVLNSQPTASVTVAISTDGKTSVNPASLTFTAADWAIPQTVTVTAVDDAVAEGPRTSTITHTATSGDVNYDGIVIADVTASITDNDSAGVTIAESGGSTHVTEGGATDTYTVVLSSQPTANVTITVATDGKTTVNPVSLTFTAADWASPQTVTVTVVDDAVAEGLHTSTITHTATSGDINYDGIAIASITATITDNDEAGITVNPTSGLVTTEAGGTATFTIVLDSQPTADVMIGLSSSAPSEGTVQPTHVTFTPGNWSRPQTVTVTGVDDFVADGTVVYTIVTAPAISEDPNYSGLDAADVSVSNTDDDTAGVLVTPTSGLVTTRSGGAATFTVVLRSRPVADVTIGLTSSNPAEGDVAPGILTFTPMNWNASQSVTVRGTDDSLRVDDVAYTIVTAASSADPVYGGLDVPDVSVTNRGRSPAGITIWPSSGMVIDEAGGTARFTVVLNTQPTADVTVGLRCSDPTEATVLPSSVTFTSADWNLPQTVTITRLDQRVTEGSASFAIVMEPAVSADRKYSGAASAELPITNDRSTDTIQVEIRRITQYGVCGPAGIAPFLVGIPGLLGMKVYRRVRTKADASARGDPRRRRALRRRQEHV